MPCARPDSRGGQHDRRAPAVFVQQACPPAGRVRRPHAHSGGGRSGDTRANNAASSSRDSGGRPASSSTADSRRSRFCTAAHGLAALAPKARLGLASCATATKDPVVRSPMSIVIVSPSCSKVMLVTPILPELACSKRTEGADGADPPGCAHTEARPVRVGAASAPMSEAQARGRA